MTFNPPLENADDKPLKWSIKKLNSWMDPDDTMDGGAKGLHAVSDSGLRCAQPDGRSMVVGSLDAALLKYGPPTPFPNPCFGPVNTTGGASYVLFNNMYNTNYVLWWPFGDDLYASIKYRFVVQF